VTLGRYSTRPNPQSRPTRWCARPTRGELAVEIAGPEDRESAALGADQLRLALLPGRKRLELARSERPAVDRRRRPLGKCFAFVGRSSARATSAGDGEPSRHNPGMSERKAGGRYRRFRAGISQRSSKGSPPHTPALARAPAREQIVGARRGKGETPLASRFRDRGLNDDRMPGRAGALIHSPLQLAGLREPWSARDHAGQRFRRSRARPPPTTALLMVYVRDVEPAVTSGLCASKAANTSSFSRGGTLKCSSASARTAET
jgi:hypothetical protein